MCVCADSKNEPNQFTLDKIRLFLMIWRVLREFCAIARFLPTMAQIATKREFLRNLWEPPSLPESPRVSPCGYAGKSGMSPTVREPPRVSPSLPGLPRASDAFWPNFRCLGVCLVFWSCFPYFFVIFGQTRRIRPQHVALGAATSKFGPMFPLWVVFYQNGQVRLPNVWRGCDRKQVRLSPCFVAVALHTSAYSRLKFPPAPWSCRGAP